jgi:hypothetical protein
MEKKKARVEYYRSLYRFFKKNRGRLQWFILLIGSVIKLVVELVFMGIASLLTFFTIKKWENKLSIYAYLMWWHLKGCPKGMGLNPIQ